MEDERSFDFRRVFGRGFWRRTGGPRRERAGAGREGKAATNSGGGPSAPRVVVYWCARVSVFSFISAAEAAAMALFN